ncbi:MAG: hypothetical protein MI802_19445 [Desulfobacterales bacterium]|nr:hypothetical protein [Desulfobacterales bacterium]
MANIKPQGEALKKAIAWISEQRRENPAKDPMALADEAAFRFDLSPKDSEFLLRFIRDERE